MLWRSQNINFIAIRWEKMPEKFIALGFDGVVAGESRPTCCEGVIRNYDGGFPAAFSAKGIQ